VDVDGAEIIVLRCRVVHADDVDADEFVPGGDVESKSVAFGAQSLQPVRVRAQLGLWAAVKLAATRWCKFVVCLGVGLID
jgi:hypothetical protein